MSERHANGIRPGFFLTKLVKDGPLLPARIWRPCHCTVNGEETHDWQPTCDRFPALLAEANGKPADVMTVWMYHDEITEAEFWQRTNNPITNPNQAVNLRAEAPIF